MKYSIEFMSSFKKALKKATKQGKDEKKLYTIIEKLASGEKLDSKYKDHALIDNKHYKNCRECHIEPDWLLVYKIIEDKLILLLIETGSHSDLFK